MSSKKTLRYVSGGHPLLGHLPEFNRDPLGLLRKMSATGDVIGLHFGPFSGMLLNKPEHVQSILVEHAYNFDKSEIVHAIFRPAIGDGIFSSEGDFHRQQRKIMAPSFQPQRIVGYAESTTYYGEHMQQTWSDGEMIDLNEQMINLAMSVIGKALFDADVFTETDELGSAMTIATEYVAYRTSKVLLPPYNWPLPRYRRTRKAVQVLHKRIQSLIDERRTHPTERNDFLSVLLQARDENDRPMSDEQLMAECLTLFGAGHESTASMLCWAWYLLCQHPAVYQKVQREVDNVLQGRTPSAQDLIHLPYCLQVFKETMRLYTPAYIVARRALRDISVDGYLIPKGCLVLLSPYTLHRREEYFPNPEKFEPERFTPEREKLLPRYAYLPFGAGPRICIGMHFSLMEGHLLLATLAQRVHFSLLPGQTIEPDPIHHISLRPAGAVNVLVKRRDIPRS